MPLLSHRQPRQFYIIFMLEFWERFGFYTVQGLLVYNFIQLLGMNEQVAVQLFGAFIALLYGLVPIGGWLGDRILGAKRAIVLGMCLLVLGYSYLALHGNIYISLAVICVGNGIFKANPANLLSRCYKKDDPNLHSGFTLYYMSINLGAMLALYIGPAIALRYGYSMAYSLSAIGILFGLVNYLLKWRELAPITATGDLRAVSVAGGCKLLAGLFLGIFACVWLLQHQITTCILLFMLTIVLSIIYFRLRARENDARIRDKMLLAFILMAESVIFYTLYQQMPTSLNLFAIHHVTPYLLGLYINPVSLQLLNPVWIIGLSPLFALMYERLESYGIDFPIIYKFAFGMSCCGLSFILLYFARFMADSAGMVASWWLVGSYLLQSISELLISALGLAMIAELVPAHIAGLSMGMWFLTSSISGFTGATLASYTAMPTNATVGMATLLLYTHAFLIIGVITVGISIMLFALAPILGRLMTSQSGNCR